MGLGKTVDIIALFAYLEEYHQNKGPHLVVCPKSVLNNWYNEFTKWYPSINVKVLLGTMKERE